MKIPKKTFRLTLWFRKQHELHGWMEHLASKGVWCAIMENEDKGEFALFREGVDSQGAIPEDIRNYKIVKVYDCRPGGF